MEDELDLRPYFRAIVRRWRWIVLPMLIAAAVAGVMAVSRPTSFMATGSVLVRPIRSQVTLDDRFVTSEEIDDASRRKALLALARSSNIEALIPPETLTRLVGHDYRVGELTDRITVEAEGDLIMITAVAPLAEQARELADVWASGFVTYATQLHAPDSTGLEVSPGVQELRDRRAAAQKAYEEFRGTSRLDELDQRIFGLTTLISDTLAAGWAPNITNINRAQSLEAIVRDAEALREQLAQGRSAGLGESLAALSLRIRASGGGQLPMQLQLTSPEELIETDSMTLGELDTLIAALRQQITDTRALASANIEALLKGERPPAGVASSEISVEQIDAYVKELLALRQQREVQEGQRLVLEQNRDVALEALQIAQRKLVEQQVAAVLPDADVRLAGKAVLPTAPTRPPILRNIAVGAFGGAVLGIMMALLIEFVGGRVTILGRRASPEPNTNIPSPSSS